MPYIFLDFDGVLNSDAFYTRNEGASKRGDVDPRAIRCLNELVRRSGGGCKIIISSNWRHETPLAELRSILTKRGFKYPKKVVGKTPDLGDSAVRGYEILEFLRKRKALKSPFVALDDNGDMDGVEDSFVRTKATVGLQKADVERALAILKRGGCTILGPQVLDGKPVKVRKKRYRSAHTRLLNLKWVFS